MIKDYKISRVISEIMYYVTTDGKVLNWIEKDIINQCCWIICESCWLQYMYMGLERVWAQSIKESISCGVGFYLWKIVLPLKSVIFCTLFNLPGLVFAGFL